jgi:hypothetical protein
MRIRYIGAEASTETFGKTFHQGKWVSVAALDDQARETLAQNPRFEVEPAIEATPAPADEAES